MVTTFRSALTGAFRMKAHEAGFHPCSTTHCSEKQDVWSRVGPFSAGVRSKRWGAVAAQRKPERKNMSNQTLRVIEYDPFTHQTFAESNVANQRQREWMQRQDRSSCKSKMLGSLRFAGDGHGAATWRCSGLGRITRSRAVRAGAVRAGDGVATSCPTNRPGDAGAGKFHPTLQPLTA